MSEHDNLSEFIRKALRRPDIDFNEGDWSKLEKMLDANSSKSPAGGQYRWKAGLISVVALLILSTGAYYFFTPGHKQDVAGHETSTKKCKLSENKTAAEFHANS